MNQHAYATKDSPRPTMAEARAILEKRGWTFSGGSWEDENHVYAFAAESYPGTYGGAAAAVHWSIAGAYLSVPPVKPKNVRFV